MTYAELLERIGAVRERVGNVPGLADVIEAGRDGDLETAAELLEAVEREAESYLRAQDLESRAETVLASDEEQADLHIALARDPAAAEATLRTLEARETDLRLKAILGAPVAFGRFLGEWVQGRLYEPGDVVRDADALYICTAATKRRPPGEGWELLSRPTMSIVGASGGSQGPKGDQGDPGPPGPKGDTGDPGTITTIDGGSP